MHFIICIFGVLAWINIQAQSNLTKTIQHDGMTREYKIYIPASYVNGNPVPLVFNLHGYTSNMTQQEVYGDFRPIADTANFIIVHPNGTFDNSGNRWWNAYGLAAPDDVDFISKLIDSVSADYSIDPERIYSTGMSNGGFMSFELACTLGNRIAAVASVTGTMPAGSFSGCNAPKPTPIMQIHGTADPTVPYNGSASLESVPAVVGYWVGQTNSNTTPTVINVPDTDPNDGCTAEHYIYPGGDQNSSVEHFKIINGGHTWPGAPVNIGTTNHDIDASVEIWRFFSKYRLNELLSVEESDKPADELKVYPNPSEGQLNLYFSQGSGSYEIIDALGRIVLSADIVSTQNTVFLKDKGVYFLRYNSGSETKTVKFIVH
ncbi:MAG: PHB depolymerase family esterase [Brumimicrobium sp.]|nr:PHB depolymerase family esterase [Brumimicrobium sp.]